MINSLGMRTEQVFTDCSSRDFTDNFARLLVRRVEIPDHFRKSIGEQLGRSYPTDEMLEIFLKNWGDINRKWENGNTLLHFAMCDIYGPLIKLLKKGADPNIENDRKETPFQLLLSNKPGPAITEAFLDHDADCNAQNKDRDTVLHLFSRNRNITQKALKQNPNLEIKNSSGLSPLQCVMNNASILKKLEFFELIELYVDHCVNPNTRNLSGKTILHLCCEEISKTGKDYFSLYLRIIEKTLKLNPNLTIQDHRLNTAIYHVDWWFGAPTEAIGKAYKLLKDYKPHAAPKAVSEEKKEN